MHDDQVALANWSPLDGLPLTCVSSKLNAVTTALPGESRWQQGPRSRGRVHGLGVSAVLVVHLLFISKITPPPHRKNPLSTPFYT